MKVAKVECYANGQLIGINESDPWFICSNTMQATINWSRLVATRYTTRVCQAKTQPITVIIDQIHVHGDCDTSFYALTKTRIDEVMPCFTDDGCNVTVYYPVEIANWE